MKPFFSFLLIIFCFTEYASSQNLLDSAVYFQKSKNYDKAIDLCIKYLKTSDLSPSEKNNVHFTLAYCYKKNQLPSEAIKEYLKSIYAFDDSLRNGMAYYNMANIYKSFHLYDQAISNYNKALRLNKSRDLEGKYKTSRAIAYKYSGQYDKALEDILNVEEIAYAELESRKRMLFNAYNQRGLIYKSMSEYDKSIKFFRHANDLELNKNTFINIGLTYELLGDTLRAIESYLAALSLKQNVDQKFKTYQNLGRVFFDLNNKDKSSFYLKKAESLFNQLDYPEGEDIEIFLTMGDFHNKFGSVTDAVLYYKKSALHYKDLDQKKTDLLMESERNTLINIEESFYDQKEKAMREKFIFQSLMTFIAVLILSLIGTKIYYTFKRRATIKTVKTIRATIESNSQIIR